ncbi:hypothethical protein [Ralstonia solanacearum PSI07]|nr:hypothethical protein [Ralstonia solanacearum PSI07]
MRLTSTSGTGEAGKVASAPAEGLILVRGISTPSHIPLSRHFRLCEIVPGRKTSAETLRLTTQYFGFEAMRSGTGGSRRLSTPLSLQPAHTSPG